MKINRFLETSFLYYSSLLLGCGIIIFGTVLGDHEYGQLPSDAYIRKVMLIGVPWIIFTSVLVVIRREVPRPWNSSIKGFFAILQGIVGLIIFGGAEIYLLFDLLQEIFRQ